MSRTWRAAIALVPLVFPLVASSFATAQDTRAVALETCRQRLEILDKEYVAACAAWLGSLETSETSASRPAKPPPAALFLPRYVSVADDFAGTVGETRALIRAMLLIPWNHQDSDGRAARLLERLGNASADEPELAALCDHLHLCAPTLGESRVVAALERIRSRTGLDAVRAATTFHLATLGIEYKSPAAAERDRLMGLIAELQRRHADSPYTKAIDPYLFELEKLQPGMNAPALEGPDESGKIFTLAELKGRTTVLVFFDPASRPCAELLPTLEELAARTDAARIHLMLVIGTPRPEAKDAVKLPGRIMIDRTADQRLFSTWNVFATPMIYVLDKEGIIRHRHLRDRALVAAVESLNAGR